MTRRKWDKLRLQVILGGHPNHNIVFGETGWCDECLHFKTCPSGNDRREDHKIQIPTYDKNGIVKEEAWWTCWAPKKFDKEK
jgi:hypothetical protein